MKNVSKEIEKLRQKIKKGPADILKNKKPFADGMYRFSMFMIDYYSRVREQLKLDYDSFMIVQTVVSHTLYQMNKKEKKGTTYEELENEWEKIFSKESLSLDVFDEYELRKNISRLTISSICLVTSMPKETARRKIITLCKKNLLKITNKDGVLIGSQYKIIFKEFVPQTVLGFSKLLKNWEKTGILNSILRFQL